MIDDLDRTVRETCERRPVDEEPAVRPPVSRLRLALAALLSIATFTALNGLEGSSLLAGALAGAVIAAFALGVDHFARRR